MKKLIFVLLSIALSNLVIFTSCCKKPCSPKATVNVVDEKGNPVAGAQIIIQANEGNTIYLTSGVKNQDIAQSDEAGQSKYEFRYEAIYNVKVIKPKDYSNLYERSGVGVLVLKEGKVCTETIVIR